MIRSLIIIAFVVFVGTDNCSVATEAPPAFARFCESNGVTGVEETVDVITVNADLARILLDIERDMKVVRSPQGASMNGTSGPKTIDEARGYLYEHVNMVCPPVVCTEYDNVFFFSGGTSTRPVKDFSSGFAIKKGLRPIFGWEKNRCDEIGQLAEKVFVAITRTRDYSAIGQFVSKVDALTGGGRQVDERAHEAFLDLLKRLVDFQSDDQEVRMCVYEAQVRLVSRILPLDVDAARFSERMRRMMAVRLKGFLKYLDDRIIPGFKLKPVYLNVGPPIEAIEASSNVFVGFNLESVSDPNVRQIWEKAIEENHKNSIMNKEQIVLSRMKAHYGAWVCEAIKALSMDCDNEENAEKVDKSQMPARNDSGNTGSDLTATVNHHSSGSL